MLTSKKGRKVGKSALKVGALAAVGGLAWKAYQQYSQNQSGQQVPNQPSAQQPSHRPTPHQYTQLQEQQFNHVVEDTNPNGQMIIMQAMIAAAHSDGHIDETERQRIFTQVDTLDLSLADKASLFDELRQPLTLPLLVSKVPDAQTGIEVYAACASVIDLTQAQSQQYLSQLANQLCIPLELTQAIQQELQV